MTSCSTSSRLGSSGSSTQTRTTGTATGAVLATVAEDSDTSATTDILGRAGDAKTLESVTAIGIETVIGTEA